MFYTVFESIVFQIQEVSLSVEMPHIGSIKIHYESAENSFICLNPSLSINTQK